MNCRIQALRDVAVPSSTNKAHDEVLQNLTVPGVECQHDMSHFQSSCLSSSLSGYMFGVAQHPHRLANPWEGVPPL